MAGLQCFGCGQGFGFFRREVSFTFLLWMKTLRRFTFHDIFCDFLYERWPVSGLLKLNFFVSSLLKSTSDTTKSLRLLYSFVTYCYIRSSFVVRCVKIHAFFPQIRFPTFVDNFIDIKIFVAKRANLSLFFYHYCLTCNLSMDVRNVDDFFALDALLNQLFYHNMDQRKWKSVINATGIWRG